MIYDYKIDYRPASEHWTPSELMAAVLYLPNRDGVGAAEVNANSYPERDSILFGVSSIGQQLVYILTRTMGLYYVDNRI